MTPGQSQRPPQSISLITQVLHNCKCRFPLCSRRSSALVVAACASGLRWLPLGSPENMRYSYRIVDDVVVPIVVFPSSQYSPRVRRYTSAVMGEAAARLSRHLFTSGSERRWPYLATLGTKLSGRLLQSRFRLNFYAGPTGVASRGIRYRGFSDAPATNVVSSSAVQDKNNYDGFKLSVFSLSPITFLS